MSRPLDFIVFGVPRSGTKALVRALNLHPQVYCAMERFHFHTDHSQLSFPDSFVDASNIWDRQDLAKIESIRRALTKKQDVRYVGNKLPRYYLALQRINREIPHLKNIWIYRSPYGFMPSWNRRELDHHKGQWPAGQIGLIGLLELLVCIENSLALGKDVFVFPYAHGLTQSPEVTLQSIAFIGADPLLYDRSTFEKKQRLQAEKQRTRGKEGLQRLALAPFEEELLQALRISELDVILEQGRGFLLSEVGAPLNEFLAHAAGVLPIAIDRAFKACDNHALPSFAREYLRRNQANFAGLLKLADGSKALASLQRSGTFERLRSLYVQRWAFRRKLAALRFGGSAWA
jgi:hypothetical protein